MRRLLIVLAGVALCAPSASAANQQTIATATVEDFRITLVAVKGPDDGGAPLASVRIEAFVQERGKWRSVGRRTVGRPNGFFWHPLRGPGGIRRFSVSSFPVKRVTFQLLITPSAGWSPLYRFHVKRGRLKPG
jgi:hypothetical protein